MESYFDYVDVVEREVLVEKLMKERKKRIFIMFSALPLAPGSLFVHEDHKCVANHHQGRGRKQSRDGVT